MEKFQLNSKIELIKDDEEYTSGLIYDISDDKLYVSIPSADKSFKLLYEDEEIQGIVYSKDQILGFTCIVSKRIYGENPIYELSNLSDFTRIQRRNDIRVPYTRPIFYTRDKVFLDTEPGQEYVYGITAEMSDSLKEGMILDISGGGIKFACGEDIPLEEDLFFVLNINNYTIGVKGKIVHKEINILPKQTKYSYGIKFLDLDERLRERIIQFVFILMRRNRVK